MIDQTKINSLKSKDKIDHFLLVTNFSLKSARTGNNYLDLELRDTSISLNAKMWTGFESFSGNLKLGTVVKVLGSMDEFNNQLQIKVDRIRLATENDNISPEDFLPNSLRAIEEMEKELKDVIASITSGYLKELLGKVLSESNYSKYIRVPAGKAWHHAYIGGLLEHTLEILKICELMCKIHPEVNRELLLTGAILHDIGKIEELEYSTGFNYTDKGKLLGHIVIAANLIEKEASKIKEFPDGIKNQLLHLVLSHQGKLEYATPVVPKTIEAIILYHADELSAKTNAYKGAIEAERGNDTNWTKYLPLAETSLYITDSSEKRQDFKDTLF